MKEKKIVMITGATSGIGEACARKFAAGGYNVILTGRSEGKLKPVVQACKALGAEVYTLVFDVRDRQEAE